MSWPGIAVSGTYIREVVNPLQVLAPGRGCAPGHNRAAIVGLPDAQMTTLP